MEAKYYPLSESQKGIFYEWEKDKSLTQYNLAYLYKFPRTIDAQRLLNAFKQTVNAHPDLKVKLKMNDDDLVQYYHEDDPVEISTERVSESEINRIISEFTRPFELLQSPLYRIELYQTEEKLYALFDVHHIIFDGTSFGIFNGDLANSYEGKEILKETFTICNLAELESACIGDAVYLEAETYFKKRLKGISMSRIPTLNNKKAEPGYRQVTSEFIRQDLVNDFCTKYKISPNNLFAGALGICISRYTREQEIAFCTAHHGRLDNRLNRSLGMFVKTLPVVINVTSTQKVEDYLASIRTDMTELWSRQAFSFSAMVKQFGVSLEIVYAFQKGLTEYFVMDGYRVDVRLLREARTNERLTIFIYQTSSNYEIRCEYNDSLYEHKFVQTFTASIKNIVLNMIAGEHRTCSELPVLLEEQEAEVIKISRGKSLAHDRTLTLVDLFREQVLRTPDRLAVVFQERKLTYADLDEITDKIAKRLYASGVRREKVVGIMIDRSEYMVIYPLAVMKAGGGYMPLDFTIPADRLRFMIKDAGADFILSEGTRMKDSFPGFEGTVINREDIWMQESADEVVLQSPSAADMFVLLYTSGSTGIPKGCILEHRNIVNFCRWYIEDFNVTEQDKSVAYANFAFDAHMMDIYPMITAGASVYILPSELRMDLLGMNRYMEENGLTIAFMTTQIGRQFAEDIDNHSLRLLSVGGERLIPTRKPPYRFYNGYGPTECTLYSTIYNIVNDYKSTVIGHSLSNVSNYILDQNQQLLPLGVVGELCIGGEGVGRGYLNRIELDKEKFIEWRGEKLYRSGDLARYNETGEIEFIGRLDNQVKLRGLRIELGEIENAMSGFEDISSAVADVKEIGGVQHLCGYFTARTRIDPDVLKDYLRTSLTEFMVPTALIQMDKFPLTGNGKVNRKALPMPETGNRVGYVAPTNEIEERICAIYSDILKIPKVGIHDNFFEIGGSSMAAIKAIIQIINVGYDIRYGDLFKLKTPKAVANFLTNHNLEAEMYGKTDPDDISGYDYTLINQVLEKGQPDLWESFEEYKLGDILLTGATGYLGIHVLRELIEKETGKIYCLVRSKGELSPEQRLKSQLMYYFSDTFDNTFSSRIIPVEGDITDSKSLKPLEGKRINAVFNCAASVKHYDTGNVLQRINVEGVVNLIEFCRHESARLIQISTMSIFGLIEGEKLENNILMDESRLYLGQKIDNKYVLTKFKAERHVLQAVCGGLDGKVMRVGNLMGRHSDGEFQINFRSNAFVNMLRSYKVMGMFPLSQLISPLEISPVDCTARAVVSLSRAPYQIKILHVYNNYRLNMANVIFAMQQYGFAISIVSDQIFNEHFGKLMQDPVRSVDLSGLLHYRSSDNLVAVPGQNNFTTTLLYKYNIRWPLASDDYSIKLIGMLDGLGFFDEDQTIKLEPENG